jgi:phage head maturation protease
MLTATLSREEAAAARAVAAEKRADEFHAREGGTLMVARWNEQTAHPVTSQRITDFKANQLRSSVEQRNGLDMFHVTGHASVVDTPYEMWDMFGPYNEIMHGDAFKTTLAADPDVNFVVNHTGLTMARTVQLDPTKKPTLELEMGQLGKYNGLVSDAWLNADAKRRPDVAMLISAIEDGLITEMSFKFMIVHGRWSEDWMTYTISEVDLDKGDVSAVNYGANPFTTISARSREWMRMAEGMPLGAKVAMQEQLSKYADVLHFRENRDLGAKAVIEARAAGQPVPGRSLATIEAMLQS